MFLETNFRSKRVKIDKFKMVAKTGSDAKIEKNSLYMIAFDLLIIKIYIHV